ncbi:hypothetical protein BAUCODRAFT_25751 [Baudoinia panamericana UAMH 10762]|uniref:Uncharacterized protein n=1 Tax=Baudoinia panamericana (strain UAMH 10762) TaxID=717646 RepID=M2N6C5_BAUPA|nr:uncharacterized protein BAUCODRAFT_25751 [Baudoinia panamericana UAMH 10762]EMC94589.1 hypothetical protein BAUCODRAFT_25751 [Baudoinia panamericana UAMH 10762]
MDHAARAAFKGAKKCFGHLVQGLENVSWGELPNHTKNHIGKDPGMTSLQVILVVVALTPGVVATPLLYTLGFSGLGPLAGSAAAAFQSTFGTIAGFSTLQSAAMAGYGAPVANAAISGMTAGSALFAELLEKRTVG